MSLPGLRLRINPSIERE